MKKIIYILLILLWAMPDALANSYTTTPNVPDNSPDAGFCKTISPVNDFLRTKHGSTTQNVNNSRVVRIFVHIMRQSNGSGGRTVAEVITALNNIVSAYSPHNICFSLLGVDEIWDTQLFNINSTAFFASDGDGDGKFDNFSPNSHSNAIDIYLFDSSKLNAGLAAGIPATALVIGGNLFGDDMVTSQALSHELGHCLGLFHTFHGSSCESGCPELVNGSNSSTCGDFVTDTPADNSKIFFCQNSSTCAWNGCTCDNSSTDANGQPYSPNVNLIMAYVEPHCMQNFTNGQGARMRNAIAQTSLLQGVTVPDNLVLTNLSISNQQLYSTLTSVTANTNVTAQSGSTATFRAEELVVLGNGFSAVSGSTFHAYIQSVCNSINFYDVNWARNGNSDKEFDINSNNTSHGSFYIYPNPATTAITCVINQPYQENGELSVYSTIGQSVESTYAQRLLVKGENRIVMDCSTWQSGIYYVVIRTESRIMSLPVTIIR